MEKANLERQKDSHCTNLMVDLIPNHSQRRHNLFSDYMKREENYDRYFAAAWLKFTPLASLKDRYNLNKLFYKIQEVAMKHIAQKGVTSHGQAYQKGTCMDNSYCVGVGPNSDFTGIKELITKIWVEQKANLVTFYREQDTNGTFNSYFICPNGFYERNAITKTNKLIFSPKSSNLETEIKTIIKIVKPIYEAPYEDNGINRVRIQSTYSTKALKEAKALELFDIYLKQIEESTTDPEKINAIIRLCVELEQLHLFFDGNGRSVFILANTLFYQNDLPPFYPTNICIFDANSLEKIAGEIIEGQKRFKSMFGTKENFDENLKLYAESVKTLTSLVSKKFPKIESFKKSLGERNFNLLFRQSALKSKYKELLEFLLQNLSTLNIDEGARGETAGSALEIAIFHDNQEALALFTKYLEPSPLSTE